MYKGSRACINDVEVAMLLLINRGFTEPKSSLSAFSLTYELGRRPKSEQTHTFRVPPTVSCACSIPQAVSTRACCLLPSANTWVKLCSLPARGFMPYNWMCMNCSEKQVYRQPQAASFPKHDHKPSRPKEALVCSQAARSDQEVRILGQEKPILNPATSPSIPMHEERACSFD